jgi:hypothetical protein
VTTVVHSERASRARSRGSNCFRAGIAREIGTYESRRTPSYRTVLASRSGAATLPTCRAGSAAFDGAARAAPHWRRRAASARWPPRGRTVEVGRSAEPNAPARARMILKPVVTRNAVEVGAALSLPLGRARACPFPPRRTNRRFGASGTGSRRP